MEMWNWVILEITYEEETYYKVLGQVDVGYNGWRINSGITKVEENGNEYQFHGISGSIYYCPKDSEELSGATDHIYNKMAKHPDSAVRIVTAKEILKNHLLSS